MMQAERYHVFLQDEAPLIGCGWRIVTVEKGRKWAKLRCEGSMRRSRLRIAVWRELEKWATLLPPRKRKRRKR